MGISVSIKQRFIGVASGGVLAWLQVPGRFKVVSREASVSYVFHKCRLNRLGRGRNSICLQSGLSQALGSVLSF